MKSCTNYSISGSWKNRQESAEHIAGRMRRLIPMLKAIDPLLEKWYYVDFEGACFDYDIYGSRLIDMINGRVAKGDFGEARPAEGFQLMFVNKADVERRSDALWLRGFVAAPRANWIDLGTKFDTIPDPRAIRYDLFKQSLLAMDATFDPVWISAGSSDLDDPHQDPRKYDRTPMPLCWMIKVSPPIAKLVTPPPSVISERYPDGSLFMAATDETFVKSNPRHLAAALAINAVIDPLNYSLPF